MSLDPHAVVALPELPARALRHHGVESRDYSGIPCCARLWDAIERRPGQSHDAAVSLDRLTVLPDDPLGGLPVHGRRCSFRDSTSWIAAISRASSG